MGAVDAVLPASSGTRLVVQRAFFPRSYLVVAAQDVVQTEDDPGGFAWHTTRLAWSQLLQGKAFQRSLGRLVADPLPAQLPPALDDAAAAAALRRELAADPLLAGSQLTLRVTRGVAVLEGWVPTVGSKVSAERVARTTTGIWEAKNRLLSDEEVAALSRDQVRACPPLAAVVRDVTVSLGHVTIALQEGASSAQVAEAERLAAALPALRSLTVLH